MAAFPLPTILAHLLAAYTVLAAPWIGRFQYREAQRGSRAGDPLARLRLYRQLLAKQAINASAVCGLWLYGGIPGTRLGLCPPRSWRVSAGLAAALVLLLLWSAVRLRPKANRVREKLQGLAGALIPDSLRELKWVAAVVVGGGISEELLFRGFFFYYLSVYLPGLNDLGKVLLTALIFGLAHLYQGWRGAAGSGVSGVVLAGFYVLSGSLLLPTLLHIMGNMRLLVIFWPARAGTRDGP